MTNNKTKGFLLGAIAAASYGMNPLFTLPLYSAGMSVDSVLFYRYALAIVELGIMMKMQKQSQITAMLITFSRKIRKNSETK